MQKPYLYIFGGLAIIISVLTVATLSYAGGSKVRIPLVTSGIEAIFENLTPPGSEHLSAPSDDLELLVGEYNPDDFKKEATTTQVIAVLDTPDKWKRFNFREYSFKIPADWEPTWPSVEDAYTTLVFQDANGDIAATLLSPAPTTGYPGHIITETKKTVSGEHHEYKAYLVHGDPDSVKTSLDMLLISKIGYESDLEVPVFDPGYGIQIISRYRDDASAIYKEMYNSVEITDEWQTFTGDHFRLEYPEEWTVTTDAGTGNRWIEFFDENNKRVAFMECPIPVTGYEGYGELTETHRTLKRADMKYALDYWHGEGLDGGKDLELIMMEMMTPPQGMEGGFGGTTCQLTAEQPNLTETFQRIHQSLTVR